MTPMLILRRAYIIRRLKKCGAVSEETAKTLAEAGVVNPGFFPKVTEMMVRQGHLLKTADGKYYLVQ